MIGIRLRRMHAVFIACAALSGCDLTVVNGCPVDANDALRQSGIKTELRKPQRCEYTIHSAPTYVEYESMFYAPDAASSLRRIILLFFNRVLGVVPTRHARFHN
jgi:hypothetical protein